MSNSSRQIVTGSLAKFKTEKDKKRPVQQDPPPNHPIPKDKSSLPINPIPRGSFQQVSAKMFLGSKLPLSGKRGSVENPLRVTGNLKAGAQPPKTQRTAELTDRSADVAKHQPLTASKLKSQKTSLTNRTQVESKMPSKREVNYSQFKQSNAPLKRPSNNSFDFKAGKRDAFSRPSQGSVGPQKVSFAEPFDRSGPNIKLLSKALRGSFKMNCPQPINDFYRPVDGPERDISGNLSNRLEGQPTATFLSSATPDYVAFKLGSEGTTSNEASNNFGSHILNESKEAASGFHDPQINSQKVIPNNWAAQRLQAELDASAASALRKKFDSATDKAEQRNSVKVGAENPFNLYSANRRKAELLRSSLRAKSPQFDAYRNQVAKRGLKPAEIEQLAAKTEQAMEVVEEALRREQGSVVDGNSTLFLGREWPLDGEPVENDRVPSPIPKPVLSPSAISASITGAKEDELILLNRKSSEHREPEPCSQSDKRSNYERFINNNASARSKDGTNIPIIPSKYHTHNPRLISPHAAAPSDDIPSAERRESPQPELKKPLEPPETEEPFQQNFAHNLPIKEPSPCSSRVEEPASLILSLMTDCKSFPKFDKATAIVKNFGKICGFAANTHRGKTRNYNEDRVSILLNAQKKFKKLNRDSGGGPRNCALFSIFDGHGGSSCCNYLKDNLHNALLEHLDIEGLLIPSVKPIYKRIDEEYQKLSKRLGQTISGSCAITAIIVDDSLIVFNVGDSRAIVQKRDGKSVQELSADHKPDKLSEFSRIVENGGELYKVSSDLEQFKNQFHFAKNYKDFKAIVETEKRSPQLVFGPWRVKPGSLSVSRTFGDIEAKLPEFGGIPNIITAEPDVFDCDLSDADFLVLGCDGVFDQMSNAQVVEAVQETLAFYRAKFDAKLISSEEVFSECVNNVIRRAMVQNSEDNLTCIIIFFVNPLL